MHHEWPPQFQTASGSMMPVDQHMAVQNVAVRFGIPDVSDDAGKFRVHMLDVLWIDARVIDTEFNVVRFQLDRLPAIAGQLPSLVDIEPVNVLHVAKRFRSATAVRALVATTLGLGRRSALFLGCLLLCFHRRGHANAPIVTLVDFSQRLRNSRTWIPRCRRLAERIRIPASASGHQRPQNPYDCRKRTSVIRAKKSGEFRLEVKTHHRKCD